MEIKISPLSYDLNDGEIVMCTITNKSYLFKNNELNLIKQKENVSELIPKWLIKNINDIGLKDVRLSCAVHELYEYYANSRMPNISISEHSEWLIIVNERLDWIDNNTELIKYALVN